jgi:hydrogenase expression/formation protein HypD
MKFAEEFRDPAAARGLVRSITELADDGEYKFMEVCGGHTHTIYRHGLEHLLPPSIELVHGPGCPVCVIPMGRVDDAIWLAARPDVIFTTFADMMRVPGSDESLLEARARGCDVRFVYSPLDALKIAPESPIGTCMVSPEGACAAYYNFGRLHRETAALVGRQRAAAHG